MGGGGFHRLGTPTCLLDKVSCGFQFSLFVLSLLTGSWLTNCLTERMAMEKDVFLIFYKI